MTLFRDGAPCSLVEMGDLSEAPTASSISSNHFRNVGQFLRDYEVQHPRIQSSYSPQ
jgi:hypothetical protein